MCSHYADTSSFLSGTKQQNNNNNNMKIEKNLHSSNAVGRFCASFEIYIYKVIVLWTCGVGWIIKTGYIIRDYDRIPLLIFSFFLLPTLKDHLKKKKS